MSIKERRTSPIAVLLIGLMVAISLQTSEAFVAWVVNSRQFSKKCASHNMHPLHSSLNDCGEASDDVIEKLILSLSKEPTDESRRARLKNIFDEKIRNDKGHAAQFSSQFNQVLITVGDRIKLEAISEAQNAKRNGRDDDEEEEPQPLAEKTESELQLWALVDMMVQSKTIVRKALS